MLRDVEESRLFAQAIHGHPTITSFLDGEDFPYESLGVLYSALATLPALESISLSRYQPQTAPENESALAHHEGLAELLRVPSLRSVCFSEFEFTSALYQATANALMEGTAITDLEFTHCSLSREESAVITANGLMMANGLSRNTSVICITFDETLDQALFDALATSLSLNSTLRRLDLRWQDWDETIDLSPVLLALGSNTGLKDVLFAGFGSSMNEPLCTAMQDGLGMNTTIESLELRCEPLTDDNFDLWCTALSFLHTNKNLKCLEVNLDQNFTQSYHAAFRTAIACILEKDVSLQSLSILGSFWGPIGAGKYAALVPAFALNRTLKTLRFRASTMHLTDDEDKHMAVLLQRNIALESLPDINHQAGDAGAILRLNKAGRRYLVEDGSSISKGVEVLSAVSNDINCVFFHLLENPTLCDRSAVEETASACLEGSRGSTSSANRDGKREQD